MSARKRIKSATFKVYSHHNSDPFKNDISQCKKAVNFAVISVTSIQHHLICKWSILSGSWTKHHWIKSKIISPRVNQMPANFRDGGQIITRLYLTLLRLNVKVIMLVRMCFDSLPMQSSSEKKRQFKVERYYITIIT